MIQMRTAGQSATDEAEIQAAFAQIVCRALWEEHEERRGPRPGRWRRSPSCTGTWTRRWSRWGPWGGRAEAAGGASGRQGWKPDAAHAAAGGGSAPRGRRDAVLDRLERAAVLHAEEHQGGRYFELGHDWLAKKVLELKRERKQEEEKALELEAEALRWRREKVARRKLILRTAVVTATALLLLGLFIWWGQQETRECLQPVPHGGGLGADGAGATRRGDEAARRGQAPPEG